ncbi:stage II sporulation protein M [Clostridium sp. D2Q-14]|uniref:stage II sporulation protein M n=1 Tax=Anaeromonas gelatinilytica TaxID=2683194 RepID=UPI00193BCC6C|nr:stage II sporulation protein M [Anaeromonas gelatinilytica]MBS4534511.1 stage II sporulation protein M [Anaeromonas gelatinilytica]
MKLKLKSFSTVRGVITIFFLFFVIGILVAILINPESGDITNLDKYKSLRKILNNNVILILIIYVISILSPIPPIIIIAQNGLVLGASITWIIKFNPILLILLLPHGIFEVPSILATAFIINRGRNLFRDDPRVFVKILFIHLLVTILLAIIEAYITPELIRYI